MSEIKKELNDAALTGVTGGNFPLDGYSCQKEEDPDPVTDTHAVEEPSIGALHKEEKR